MRSWRAYIAGNQRLMDQMNKDLQAKHDMTLAEYRILIMLSEAPGNSLRMSDLADGVLSSRSRLTHQIRRMEEQGMVRRSTCEDDGRGVLAHLTDEGRRRHEEAAPTHVDGVRRNFIDLLTPEQLSIVGAVFAKVDEVIAERASG
ncbi:MarR family winged helix-turn-helix transcriptional regulator [Antrihabitans stalactiti]|uniref:MarR family transcriptional regulator n=1 Tax=Antrihabitans stalactiti TaxID=2584121 RepID=A0A848KJV2_9NOCA|nr:MarR family transcriptional regulator [Antrihabitans stalactiti]NMN98539.1 MarR family transcriptional regulator [Antrihabitans stalactiti]